MGPWAVFVAGERCVLGIECIRDSASNRLGSEKGWAKRDRSGRPRSAAQTSQAQFAKGRVNWELATQSR